MQSCNAEKDTPEVLALENCDFETIFRQSPQFMLILAPDAPRFTIIDATNAYMKNSLRKHESFIGRGLFEAYPTNHDTELARGESRIRASLERVLATQESDKILMQKYDIPRPNTDANGSAEFVFEERYRSLLHTPIFCFDGGEQEQQSIRFILQRVDDVTSYVSALKKEEEFARRNAQLTEVTSEMQLIIPERSEEVTEANSALKAINAKLQLALLAEAASRAKEEFQANISHEIRTSLNAVIGFAQLLGQDPSVAPAHREQIQAIHKAGDHLLQLIDQVLDAAKIDRGMMVLCEKPVCPAEVLQEVAQLMSGSCRSKGLDFIVKIEPSLPRRILADPLRIRQMLLNLLSNAVKYTAEGEVELTARALPDLDDPGGVQLEICIRDTGSGIFEEDLPHLFSRYTQARGRPALGGTGLGLAIANDLAKLMNGNISVTSKLGSGSQFTLRITARIVAEEASGKEDALYLQQCVPEDSRKLILIVDDVETNRQLLRSALMQLGFKNLIEYADGADAVEDLCAWKSPPVIIFMDLYMPRMSGFDATKIIRNLSWGQQTAIIAVSASSKGSRFAENEALFDSFLSKPFSLDDLVFMLKSCGQFKFETIRGEPMPRPTCTIAAPIPVALAPQTKSHRFMVVDDNILNLKVVSSMLERAGHQVEAFCDGFAAIERFSRQSHNRQFEFVILDKNMPGTDGLETARRIRALELECENKVTLLALTANDVNDANVAEFREAGIDRVLTKPLMMPVLLRTIQECSSSSDQQQQEEHHQQH